jgi:tetratricopeptide (TPR) repeat protein
MLKKLIFILMFSLPLAVFSQEEIYLAKAQQALNKKNYTEAISFYSQAISENDKNPESFYNRGLAYMFIQRFDDALSDFNSVIKLDTTVVDAFNNRGYLFYLNSQYDFALDDFNKAISLDSKFTEAYINRGSNYIDMKKYNEAITDLIKAQSFDKKNPSINLELGRAYYKKKEYEKAIDNYSKSIKKGLKNSKIYYNRGNAYYNLKDYKNAIKDYSFGIKLDSTDAECLNNRAIAYDKIGDTVSAENDRKRLGTLSGNSEMFVPYETIKYIPLKDSTGRINFSIPSSWKMHELQTEKVSELIVSPEPLALFTSPFNVGVRMSLNSNMFSQYQIENKDSLLEFWHGSILQNSKNYFSYNIMSEKVLVKGQYKGRLNKVLVQFDKDGYKYIFYEFGLAKENELFFAFFQVPDKQYEYFAPIFEKIIDSININ